MSRQRRTFFSLYLAVFISSLGLGILSPVLPSYIERFAADTIVISVIFASYAATRTLFMPPVGFLADRHGKRGFILLGLTLFTLTSPLYVLAADPLSLVLVRCLQGAAAAMLMPVAMAYVGELTAPGREGLVMGSFNTAFFAGLGFGPLLGGLLQDRWGPTAPFWGMGAMAALALLFTLFTLPPGQRPLPPHPSREGASRKGFFRPALLLERRMAGILAFRFTRSFGIGVVWMFLPLYGAGPVGLTAFQVGLLLSANTFLTTFLQAPLGHLSDRVGHHRCIAWGSWVWVAALVAIPFAPGFGGLLLLSALLGVAGALTLPAGAAQALQIGRKEGIGGVMGLYNAALSLGTMLGPLAGGVTTDLAGGMRPVFLLAAGVGLAGWIAYHLLYVRAPGKGRGEDPFFVNLETD